MAKLSVKRKRDWALPPGAVRARKKAREEELVRAFAESLRDQKEEAKDGDK